MLNEMFVIIKMLCVLLFEFPMNLVVAYLERCTQC